ncbi:MAG: leucine-rich repeat domain-containing protein [Thermoguttaceae bacterium]|nr:leucine-rich repeat domain-containing protein [Thermoguttaceae bacterium]
MSRFWTLLLCCLALLILAFLVLGHIRRASFEWEGTKITKFIGKETHVVIPKGTTEIGAGAFLTCDSIKTVVIPEGVTKIGDHVFAGCTELTSVVLPEGVTEIGWGAFDSCDALTSINIPDSVREIRDHAFHFCYSLKEWTISPTHPYFKSAGAGLLTKDGKILLECHGAVGEYRIPDGVTKINEYAFGGSKFLTSVVIPEGVTEIDEAAFLFCDALTSVEIPEGVTEIGSEAFNHCPNLTIHAPAGATVEKYAKENKIPFEAK